MPRFGAGRSTGGVVGRWLRGDGDVPLPFPSSDPPSSTSCMKPTGWALDPNVPVTGCILIGQWGPVVHHFVSLAMWGSSSWEVVAVTRGPAVASSSSCSGRDAAEVVTCTRLCVVGEDGDGCPRPDLVSVDRFGFTGRRHRPWWHWHGVRLRPWYDVGLERRSLSVSLSVSEVLGVWSWCAGSRLGTWKSGR